MAFDGARWFHEGFILDVHVAVVARINYRPISPEHIFETRKKAFFVELCVDLLIRPLFKTNSVAFSSIKSALNQAINLTVSSWNSRKEFLWSWLIDQTRCRCWNKYDCNKLRNEWFCITYQEYVLSRMSLLELSRRRLSISTSAEMVATDGVRGASV